MVKERYSRNIGALTEEESEKLHAKSVCVVGCGGIGGYVIEHLSRIGVGSLTVVDGDNFVLSNLNRQLLSSEDTIGESKVYAAFEHINRVNSEIMVNAVPSYINEENVDSILKNHDIVIDALDNVPARRMLNESCSRLGIPLVHGAISGWCAQISVIMPGSQTLDSIYPCDPPKENPPSSLSFTPALAASIQAAEAIKLLLDKEAALQNKLLIVDLMTQEYRTIVL